MIDTSSGPRRLAQHWWVLLLRGVLAVLFGVLVILHPLSAVATFVVIFGAFVFADGLFALVAAVRFHNPDTARWWYTIAHAVAGLAVGIVTFLDPRITSQALGLLIAAWAILTGIAEIATGVRMRAYIPGEIFLILAGLASIVLGVCFLAAPLFPLVVLTFVIAAYCLIAGAALIIIAMRMRDIAATGRGLRP